MKNEKNEISDEIIELAIKIKSLGIEDSAGYKNLNAIKDYTVNTRDMFRSMEKKLDLHINQVKQLNLIITQLKEQITQLQIKLYTKNSTS